LVFLFLNGVAVQSLDVLSRAERINALVIDWQLKVGSGSGGVAQNMVKYLAVNPYVTTTKVAESLNVAFTTAQRVIAKLEALEIVTQVSVGKRDKMYCATEILRILEEPTKITERLDGTLQ
jgi:DeoR-like helix-turn-helix domain.